MGAANPAVCWGPQMAQSVKFLKSGPIYLFIWFFKIKSNLFVFKKAQSHMFFFPL